MTKVEELKEKLFGKNKTESYTNYLGVVHTTETFHRITPEDLDSLITAAKEEGAEQERERIARLVVPDEDEYGNMTIGWLSLSVLSPAPKEKP
jgi:hypothetical protein